MGTLAATSLVKRYGKRTVVKDVSIEVTRGEVVGLLGPNGAGKTTSFYMIVGLVPADEGVVMLNDEEITHLPMHVRARRGIGYLAQEPSVFRRLTVEDNLLAILELGHRTRREREARAAELLAEFDQPVAARLLHVQHVDAQLHQIGHDLGDVAIRILRR